MLLHVTQSVSVRLVVLLICKQSDERSCILIFKSQLIYTARQSTLVIIWWFLTFHVETQHLILIKLFMFQQLNTRFYANLWHTFAVALIPISLCIGEMSLCHVLPLGLSANLIHVEQEETRKRHSRLSISRSFTSLHSKNSSKIVENRLRRETEEWFETD